MLLKASMEYSKSLIGAKLSTNAIFQQVWVKKKTNLSQNLKFFVLSVGDLLTKCAKYLLNT